MGYDDVISHMGEFGRYQKRTYYLLCLPAIICAFHEMGGVFLGAKANFRCLLPQENPDNASFSLPSDVANINHPWDDKTKSWSQCERYNIDSSNHYNISVGNLSKSLFTVKCDSFVYDKSQYTMTTITEWNLVCDNSWLRATGDSLFMVGVMFGSMFFSTLSDTYGRRPILILSLIVQLIGGILVAVSPDFVSYIIFRSIVGSATSGVFLIAFVIALEMIGPKTRLTAEIGMQAFYSMGYFFITVLAYFIRSWRILEIAFVVPSIAFLAYWWFVPESIRWLLTKNRLQEAKDLVEKVSLENGEKLSKEKLDDLLSKASDGEPDLKQPSALDLVRYPNLRKNSLLMCLMWFVNSGTYFGLSWNTASLAGNEYINFGISAAVELPAYVFLLLTLDRWGRKIVVCGCMLIAGTSLLCTLLVPDDMSWLAVVFAMFGKFAITCSATAVLVFAAELFPTVIRNVGLGTSGICARIGAIIAPYINLLSEVWEPLPLAIFGFSALAAGMLSLLLPETLNEKLPDSIQDGEQFGKKRKQDVENWMDPKIIEPSSIPENKKSKKQNRLH